MTHVTYIMQKWHFTAILFAFIYNATFCTLMITKLLWQATSTNTFSRSLKYFNNYVKVFYDPFAA